MRATALSFRSMGVMAVVFAAAAGHFAMPTPWVVVGGRLVDVERLLGVLMRSARAALANARRRLC